MQNQISLKNCRDFEGPRSPKGCCKLFCSDECQMSQGKCLRAGDTVSIRKAMWENMEDSKCFELTLFLRHLEFS